MHYFSFSAHFADTCEEEENTDSNFNTEENLYNIVISFISKPEVHLFAFYLNKAIFEYTLATFVITTFQITTFAACVKYFKSYVYYKNLLIVKKLIFCYNYDNIITCIIFK